MKLELALVLVHFQMFSNVFPMQVLPLLLWATPRPPARATALSTGTTRHFCNLWVTLLSFLCQFCRFHLFFSWYISWEVERVPNQRRSKNISSFDIHLSVPYCVVIIYISERALCMNEKKIVLANFCLGKLFLWAWRHFYDIYWFLHNFAAVLWPL